MAPEALGPAHVSTLVEAREPVQENEARFRFLSELAEGTRDLTDPTTVMAVVARMLGEHMRVSRCAYAEVDADSDHFTIRHDYTDGCASTVGNYELNLFGARAAADQRAGRTLVVHDVDRELRAGDGADMFNAIGIKAIICCPLIRAGRLVAMMAVHQTTPRSFSAHEVALVEAVVERSWAYIERARALRALADSERNLRQLADAMPQIVWAARPDGVLDYYNRRWFEYIEVAPDEIDRASWDKYIHPDDLGQAYERWAASVASGEHYTIEFRVRRHDGAYRWFLVRALPIHDEHGSITRWFGTCTDIHDKRIADEAIRFGREQMEIVVQGADVGVWYCPLPFDKLIWDAKVKEHFHLPPDTEVTIELFYERIHPDDRERTRAAIAESIASRTPYDIDYRTVSADGLQTKWIRALGRTFYAADGTPRQFDGVTSDVTARMRAEIALRESERERAALLDSERAARIEAERASRMKDEFLATLSHELRTPLNAILGWAHIIQRGKSGRDDIAKGLAVIERNARAQAQIIEDLLDMSGIISGKIRLDVQRIDLANVVQSALETARPAADGKGIALSAVLDPLHGVVVTGDANRLHQVLWNLLSNAIKFTPRGGRIQVLLERVHSHLELSVIDNGQGIAPEFLSYVFDRFRQADATTTRQHGGLGLGLAIVKQLVELHGGTVSVRSRGVGFGSTFVVLLPITAVHPSVEELDKRHPSAPPSEAGAALLASSHVELAGLSILVVDDEPDARALVQRVLEDNGGSVAIVGSAQEALALLAQRRFDLLVSDIGMPNQDGYALIREVRALGAAAGGQLPAIALTAYARAEDRVKALRAGYQMHLVKPIEPTELLTVVASLLGRVSAP
ncbi:MAG: histidine kinase [Myxococcaceae bacterium]|nr:histidine kinase [Myxococcaceae bacterium]